jgi:hypothetical protein
MKKLSVIIAAILCVVLLAGCKATAIEGTWKDDSGVTYLFDKNMKFSININADTTVTGSFAIPKDSNQITLTMDAPSGQAVVKVATFKLDTTTKPATLTIVGQDGATSVLRQQ